MKIFISATNLFFGCSYMGWQKAIEKADIKVDPSAFIGASNFFELSVAVALILFGMNSGATLATVVGVLTEVPVMLHLVKIMKVNRDKFNFKGV